MLGKLHTSFEDRTPPAQKAGGVSASCKSEIDSLPEESGSTGGLKENQAF